ncbi:hypothetical protein Tco_0031018 [Tanacetum coccineum]
MLAVCLFDEHRSRAKPELTPCVEGKGKQLQLNNKLGTQSLVSTGIRQRRRSTSRPFYNSRAWTQATGEAITAPLTPTNDASARL